MSVRQNYVWLWEVCITEIVWPVGWMRAVVAECISEYSFCRPLSMPRRKEAERRLLERHSKWDFINWETGSHLIIDAVLYSYFLVSWIFESSQKKKHRTFYDDVIKNYRSLLP